MTTDIDKAIEAAVKQAGHVLDESSLEITSREYLINKDVTEGTIEMAIRTHIMPVVEELKAENARLDETLESSDMLLQGARHYVGELKALVREFQGDNDMDGHFARACKTCHEDMPRNSKGHILLLCKNPECAALKLREVSKE